MKALEYLLNFRTNKATINDTNGQVRTLKENILGIGTSLSKVQTDLTKFAHSQKWANITNLATSVSSGFKNIAGNVKNAFVGSYEFIDKFATEGDKAAKTARLLGLSVKDYKGLSFAADRSGIGLETMNTAMQKLNVTLGKAKSGDKTASKIFGALLPENVNKYASSKDVLLAMADSYTKLNATQKAFVSSEVFGRSGLQMAELLGGGSAGVSALLNEYEALGGGLTDEQAKNSETFKDDLTNMNVTLESMKTTVAGALLPAFSALFKSITNYFKENRGTIQAAIKDFSGKLVDGVMKIIPKIPKLLDGIGWIAGKIADIVNFIGPIKTILGVGIVASLGSIITMITAVVGLVGGPALAGITGVSVLVAEIAALCAQIYENWDMLSSLTMDEFFNAIKMSISELSDAFANAIGDGVVKGWTSALRHVPLLGRLFGSDLKFDAPSVEDLGSQVGSMMQQSTVTNRFSVDFKNVPAGVRVTAPSSGDFDYSKSYGSVLGGAY